MKKNHAIKKTRNDVFKSFQGNPYTEKKSLGLETFNKFKFNFE